MINYLDCAAETGSICADEFGVFGDDYSLKLATIHRSILDSSQPGTEARASDCEGCGTADAIGGAWGAALGTAIAPVVGTMIGGGFYAAVVSIGWWAETSGIAAPPGGGTGIDCDLAADKEKCYYMRELVYAHDLILDELTEIWLPETDDFTWEDATRVLEAAYHIQDTEFGYRRCAANLENGAPEASRGADDVTLNDAITQEASARSGPDWPWGSWPPGCPGPYDQTPIDDKFPFLTFGGLNDEIGMCIDGDDTTGRDIDIPYEAILLFIEWILKHIPGEDGFGLSTSGTGIGAMTAEEIRVEFSKEWSDSDDDHMQLARMQFTRSSNSDLFAMDSDTDEQQLRAYGGIVDALVLFYTHDPAMAAAFSRIADLVARSTTGGISPNLTVEEPLKSCPIDFIESVDVENDEALLRYSVVENDDVEEQVSEGASDDDDDGLLPGFTLSVGILALLGAAMITSRMPRLEE